MADRRPAADVTSMQLLIGSILLGVTMALVGFLSGYRANSSSDPGAADATDVTPTAAVDTTAALSSSSAPPTSAPTSTTASSLATPDSPVSVVVVDPVPGDARPDPLLIAQALAPRMVLPTDCPLPLGNPESLPNTDRSYRSGVHQGIDFICGERGRVARAATSGRVVFIQSSYQEPQVDNRTSLLDVAAEAGRTPSWTLAMLYGNHVVIDHGNIDGVGHVVSIYAHLERVDDELRLGMLVDAGTTIGEIGNTGTSTAATNGDRPQSLHLHWELHIDELYLSAGLGPEATRAVYETLFSVGQSGGG